MSLRGTSGQTRSLRVLCKNDAPCAFTGYHCSLARVEGFEYCQRHILEDKSAPFHQCNYVYVNSSKRCLRATPPSDRKEDYCSEHSRQMLRKRQKCGSKQKTSDTPDSLLKQLSHHHVAPLSSIQNAIPDPASVPSIASTALQYGIPDDVNLNYFSDLDVRLLPRAEDDSELDSAESDADPLEHAGVYTTEEASRIYLEKLQKLKSLYTGEYKRLNHVLRENRREYLHAVKTEKETMMSIHDQPKADATERDAYNELRSHARYHRHFSKEALLHKQSSEKRAMALEGSTPKSGWSAGCVKCIYSEGSWRCGIKSVPLSKYCFKHIMQDDRQVLFRRCGSLEGGSEACEVPVVPLPHTPMCVYHTPFPDALPVSEPHPQLSDCAPFVTSHPKIIDLSDTSAFIISEIPPENVMEGDPIIEVAQRDGETAPAAET